MKTIVYNEDSLINNEITELVVRVKALLINDDKILIANENGLLQFPGGHLENGEDHITGLKREIKEETGISIEEDEIKECIYKVTFMNKDWPDEGKNRQCDIYYYPVITNKLPNIDLINLTDLEKENNFKIYYISLNESIEYIKNNMPSNKGNEIISPDMIIAIEEYLKI